LAAGRVIRRKLRNAGFDLNSDQKNARSALYGSKTDKLATVDFKQASDTISARLVEEILPPAWYTVLNALRSEYYTLDGIVTPYAKFSAMGNGFTFELESLIFVSAALACCQYLKLDSSSVSVFGDDIIIPSEAYPLYTEFCRFLASQ
jgi:hypothetical protein